MHDKVAIIRERQAAMRREMTRRGILLKVVAADSGIPYDTLKTYFPADPAKEPAQLPVSAAYALCAALPADILNYLCPEGFALVQVPNGIDHDELCEAMQDYLAEKARAHRPDSPEGPAIAPCEDNVLRGKFAKVRAA